ncbi:MAG: trypsin-like peptidase domain-containing protein [Burkholderiales bacterium]|nr:trypsin-like peptidase domain-containing protein [Burkholderiales bacterium]
MIEHGNRDFRITRRRILGCALGLAAGHLAIFNKPALAESAAAIDRVKPSVIAVGTFLKTRSPAFAFRGTGFAVGDGTLVATNAHVLPGMVDSQRQEVLAIALPGTDGGAAEVRGGRVVAIDAEHDLALVRVEGAKLAPLELGDSAAVRDGASLLFTGYPIGTVLGLFPATHRAMVSAISPIAVPGLNAKQLDAKAIKRLSGKRYPIMQLDATAYPGNSGSPLYDPKTGKVVGVLNMVLVKQSRESVLSQPSGITYAIPVQPLIDLIGTAN